MLSPSLRALPAARRPGTPQRLAHLYHVHIIEAGKEQRFLVFGSFLLSFSTVRVITHSIRDQRLRWLFRNISTGRSGLHLHHLVFGILGLLATGEVASGYHPAARWARNLLASGYGVSAALTVDEFALWLNLEDVYWSKQGRESVDAAIIAAVTAFMAFDGRGLLVALGQDSVRLARDLMTHR